MEELCGDNPGVRVAELARHWISATEPIDLAKAIGYSRQAGDAALHALAPADALRYYTQALDLYPQASDPDPVLGLDLSIGLGTAQRQTGDPAFRETLLGAARRAADLGDTDRLVAAALANDRGFYSAVGIIDDEKIGILELALARLPADHHDRALVLATLCAELIFGSPLEHRQALADEALAIARSSDDDATIVRVIYHVAYALFVPPLLEQSLAWTADALTRAEQLGDPILLFHAANNRQWAASAAADIDEMDRCLAIMEAVAEQLDQPLFKWLHSYFGAFRSLIAGDLDRAEAVATDALKIGTDGGESDADFVFVAQVLSVSSQRGTVGELIPQVKQAAADNPGLPAYVAVLARVQADVGSYDEARNLLAEFAAADFDLPLDPTWMTGMLNYAEAAAECGDPIYARPVLERLAPWSDRWSCTGVSVEGPVSHYLGALAAVLGRYDEADSYFTEAAAMNERMGAKYFAARTDLQWGKMLAERQTPGDAKKARELLTKAQTAAAANGYWTVERRAMAALQLIDDAGPKG